MNSKELRNLQEAYLEVVEGQQLLNEDSRRTSNRQHTQRVRSNIKAFGSNYTPPSNFDPKAGPSGEGEVLTRKQIEKKRRKELALKARQEVGEQVDIYDIILSHLLDEGYAETPEAAESIMVNMSEEWRDSIIDEVITEGRRTSLSALSGESQDRKRGPETQDQKHRRLAMGRYSPSQYKWEKVDGRWKNMGRKDGEKD